MYLDVHLQKYCTPSQARGLAKTRRKENSYSIGAHMGLGMEMNHENVVWFVGKHEPHKPTWLAYELSLVRAQNSQCCARKPL